MSSVFKGGLFFLGGLKALKMGRKDNILSKIKERQCLMSVGSVQGMVLFKVRKGRSKHFGRDCRLTIAICRGQKDDICICYGCKE